MRLKVNQLWAEIIIDCNLFLKRTCEDFKTQPFSARDFQWLPYKLNWCLFARYKFPHLPNCALDAYKVACSFVSSIAKSLVRVMYTSYYGIGVMYESGSILVELNDSHRHELGVSAMGFDTSPDSEKVQVFKDRPEKTCEEFFVQVLNA